MAGPTLKPRATLGEIGNVALNTKEPLKKVNQLPLKVAMCMARLMKRVHSIIFIRAPQAVKVEATKKKTTTTKVAAKVEKPVAVVKPKVIPVEPEPEVQVSVHANPRFLAPLSDSIAC